MNEATHPDKWLCDPSLQAQLVAAAKAGCEVTLGFYPREFWPNESNETKPNDRWRCWIGEVPGTDMVINEGRAATLDEAVRLALKEYNRGR